MVSVRENAVRFEVGISYQWAVNAQHAIRCGIGRVRSFAVTAKRAVIRQHVRVSTAIRLFPIRTRDRAAAKLLGMSVTDLAALRQFASNPAQAVPAVPVKTRKAKAVPAAVELAMPRTGVNVDAGVFADAVGRVLQAVLGKSSLPILGHVLIEPVEGAIRLTGTDLEIGVTTTIPAMVKRFVPVCLPARMLAEALSGMEGTVNLRHDVRKNQWDKTESGVRLICGDSEQWLIPLPAEEFPQLPKDGQQFPVAWEGLPGLLKSVAPALGVDESRAILTGVLVDSTNIVTTDTHRVFVREHGMDLGAVLPKKWYNGEKPGERVVTDEPEPVVIPGRICPALTKALGCKADDAVEFGTNGKQVWFRFGETVMSSRVIDGQFPNYTKVIPAEADCTGQFVAMSGDMLAALKQVAPVAREYSNRAIFRLDKGMVTVSARSGSAGEVKASFGANIDGWQDGFTFAMSCGYMIDALSLFKGCADVRLAGSGEINQFVMTSDQLPGVKVVTMPMQA
jgi:DNA polymerase-3 subunit beta